MDSIYTRVTTAVQSPITYIYMRICSCFIFVIFVFADIQSVLTAGSRSQKRFGNDKLKDDDDNNSERMLIQSTTTQATMPMTMPHVHMYTHYICVCVCLLYGDAYCWPAAETPEMLLLFCALRILGGDFLLLYAVLFF